MAKAAGLPSASVAGKKEFLLFGRELLEAARTGNAKEHATKFRSLHPFVLFALELFIQNFQNLRDFQEFSVISNKSDFSYRGN